MDKMFPYDCNPHTLDLEVKVLRWAWDSNLFESAEELERCRIQKVNRFAGYLYPKESKDRLEPIMKLFLCLFLLDDILDIQVNSKMKSVLKAIKNHRMSLGNQRIDSLINESIRIHQQLMEDMDTDFLQKKWDEYWYQYISGLEWELSNRLEKRIPNFVEYKLQRPHSSGVFLAIHLLRNEHSPQDCQAEILELEIARLICFSNDMASYYKELSVGDFHNELILIFGKNNDLALTWALKEREKIIEKIFKLSSFFRSYSSACNHWVDHLHLMVGGCLFWGEESLRYKCFINGKPNQLK
ncbi:terpene synthase family protein [Algoriphagus formosus]|uniref:Terpene synthase n=1 Tax=Algoriphagus formosus TaxID=2007308 RepID=A0A4R5USK1_9BACT|nr:hypothetical protein [Algoriphagus aquimaris]TDK42053.1 hypothetical protein E1898_18955 [Algoriphagus aquimaris]